MGKDTVLVTGAAGFTGKYFILAAKRAGYQCVALCHHKHESVPGADACITANLLDLSSVSRAFADIQPQKVLHLAAVSFVAHGDAAEMYQTNLIGTLNLLTAVTQSAHDIEKLILASSANIYGNPPQLPITEDTPASPVNHYGISKWAMERAALEFKNLPLVICRPFNYTGIGQSSKFIIPKIVEAFKKKKPFLELGNTSVARDFSDVRDVASAYVELLEFNGSQRVFNICSGSSVKIIDLITYLTEVTGHNLEIKTRGDLVRASDIKELVGDPTRLRQAIGRTEWINFKDTLAWMLEAP